jgi:hypothetical protein
MGESIGISCSNQRSPAKIFNMNNLKYLNIKVTDRKDIKQKLQLFKLLHSIPETTGISIKFTGGYYNSKGEKKYAIEQEISHDGWNLIFHGCIEERFAIDTNQSANILFLVHANEYHF